MNTETTNKLKTGLLEKSRVIILDRRRPDVVYLWLYGLGGLACCDSWGRKESDTTEQLNWTELKVSSCITFIPTEGGSLRFSSSPSLVKWGWWATELWRLLLAFRNLCWWYEGLGCFLGPQRRLRTLPTHRDNYMKVSRSTHLHSF